MSAIGKWKHFLFGDHREVVTGLLAFAVGIIVGWVYLPFVHAKFSNTIDIGNLLSALATLVVAILINQVYAKHLSTANTDTSYLHEHLTAVSDRAKDLRKCSECCVAGRKLTNSEVATLQVAERELSNALHSFEHALTCCKVDQSSVGLDELKRHRMALKQALTDSPFPGPYGVVERNAILSAFKSLSDGITETRFRIHRHH